VDSGPLTRDTTKSGWNCHTAVFPSPLAWGSLQMFFMAWDCVGHGGKAAVTGPTSIEGWDTSRQLGHPSTGHGAEAASVPAGEGQGNWAGEGPAKDARPTAVRRHRQGKGVNDWSTEPGAV